MDQIKKEVSAAVSLLSCLGPGVQKDGAPKLDNRAYTVHCSDPPRTPPSIPGTGNCGDIVAGDSDIYVTPESAHSCGPARDTIFHEVLHAMTGKDHTASSNNQYLCASDIVYACQAKCIGVPANLNCDPKSPPDRRSASRCLVT